MADKHTNFYHNRPQQNVFWPHLNLAIDSVMYLKSISEFGPGQLERGERGYRPATTDLTLVRLLSEGRAARACSPEPLLFFQPSIKTLRGPWRKLTPPAPFLPPPLCRVEHNQAQPPNHETQVERNLQPFPAFLSRPLLLIVPETTDGNCERKHVNIAGVMDESSAEQRSSPPSRGSYYDMKRSKAFRKQPLCVRSDSCQDPTHRSTNTHMHT